MKTKNYPFAQELITDIDGGISEGDTLEEGMKNILDAKQAWLETA